MLTEKPLKIYDITGINLPAQQIGGDIEIFEIIRAESMCVAEVILRVGFHVD